MALTVEDLAKTLEDERHLGFGYECTRDLPKTRQDQLDRAVVAVANELGLDYESLFLWSNSKAGRWLTDGITGRGEGVSRSAVRRYLNAEFMADLRKEFGISRVTVTLDLSQLEAQHLAECLELSSENNKGNEEKVDGDGRTWDQFTSDLVTKVVVALQRAGASLPWDLDGHGKPFRIPTLVDD